MSSKKHILVPRFADSANVNPQNLNAKSLLSRFREPGVTWSMIHYLEPEKVFTNAPQVRITKLMPRYLWKPHLAAWYQQSADAIFYPGVMNVDEWALRIRALSGRKIPLVSTLEGLAGNPDRERQLSEWAGHPVYCQYVEPAVLRRVDYILKSSDHIIAISPFLARMGQKLYGNKISVHMLGVEGSLFTKASDRKRAMTVINIASLQPRKRPEMFLELAARFPEVDFVWFGEGEHRERFISEVERRNLGNLRFPGPKTPVELAGALQSACIFAIPSNSEGVPKVTQEAAACGLPIVVYGYYETPTVVDGHNGFVVWNDEEFCERVGTLIANPDLAARMGEQSAQMARQWNWDALAKRWEDEILNHL